MSSQPHATELNQASKVVPAVGRRRVWNRGILFGLLIGSSILIALYAFLFQLGLAGSADFQARFSEIPAFAAAHVLGSGIALLIGGFQFLPALRDRYRRLHRWMGRVYLLAVLFGGVGGVALATQADGELVGRLGFGLLGVLWLVSGWQAFRAIRRGDIRTHRIWMIRSFALTFAAVTLRIYMGVMTGPLGIETEAAYPAIAWICWVPNLILADWLITARPWKPAAAAQQAG